MQLKLDLKVETVETVEDNPVETVETVEDNPNETVFDRMRQFAKENGIEIKTMKHKY